MKYILLLIYLFLLKSINSSEIVIQFNSKLSEIPKNLSPEEFISSLSSNQLYTKIKIGTPSQELDFLINFEIYNTYIVKFDNNNKGNQRFFDNCSSTFNHLGKSEYFTDNDFQYAVNSSDIITISDTLKNYNLTFLHATYFRDSSKINYPGVIGMNVAPNQNPFHFESGFVNQLKSKGYTNNYLFTLSFNENNFNGNIIIGKNIYENYPSENFKSDYCLVTINYGYYWGWNYMTVNLNSDLLSIKEVSLKPEVGVIQLNINYKDIFKKKFFEEKIKEGKCYEKYSLYSMFYCDKDVNIDIGEFQFEIKRTGIKFSLDSKDLFMEYNNKNFFMIAFGVYIDKSKAILGYPFLKKYDMIFDLDKRHIGFYNFKIKYKPNDEETNEGKKDKKNEEDNKKEEKKDNSDNNDVKDRSKNVKKNNENNRKEESFSTEKIILILLLIFFIVLFLYLIFIVYRRCERKRKGKIFEEVFL